MLKTKSNQHGFTLIEVVVVSAISVLIFGALFASFQYSLKLINVSRAKLSAISVANQRMEYFRSLPYDNVGTILGIPPGTIPQNSTTTLNGIDFAERVLVEYVDDPADGENVADTNLIPSDYKRIKLEYTWNISGEPGKIALISNIVPRSIETTAGGGTVRINVLDDSSNLLPGASVRLVNASSTAPIDVTKTTDINGAVLFSGTPVDSNYEVTVTGPIGGNSYSIDKTYMATTTNPNPSRSPFSVLEADISTLTFQIGQLSDLLVSLKSSVTDASYVEEFSDLTSIASSTGVVSNGAALTLYETGSVYDSSGEVYVEVVPGILKKWQAVRVAADLQTDTNFSVKFYTGSGVGPYTEINNSDLPGNALGFIDSLIDISTLDPVTYPSIVVGIFLETTDTSFTPSIDQLGIYYRESEVPLASQNFTIHGNKIIGTDALSNFIYKYDVSTTTDAGGERNLGPVEFDDYQLTFSSSYDIAQGCSVYPFIQKAGIDGNMEVVVTADQSHSLRLSVLDILGRPIPGVEAVITRSGYNVTKFTGGCGQAYFPGGASAQNDYVLSISAPGYQSVNLTNISIDGDVDMSVTLDPA